MRSRRRKILAVDPAMLSMLFDRMAGPNRLTIVDGWPAGARLVGVSSHALYAENLWAFMVEHESFDDVPEGSLVPRMDIVVRDAADV